MFFAKHRLSTLLTAVATLALGACDHNKTTDPDPDPVAGCNGSTIQIGSTISTPTTWESCNVYVVTGNVGVTSTLTIEPGTVVKFKPDAGLILTGQGHLNGAGTAAAPVYFTSIKDDAHGGDTNGDGSATKPVKKDWTLVDVSGTTGSTLDYCQFLYGGKGGTVLDLSLGSASVTHCTFAHNGEDVSAPTDAVLDAHYATAGTVVQHNVFYDNVRPLSITSSFDVDDTNTFHNPDKEDEKNQYQGIVTYWDVNVTKANVRWAETEVAYVNMHNIDINQGQTLTLANNVTVKLLSGVEIVFDSPDQLINSNGAGVAFTSYKDDTRGGDSNGNAAGNAPAAGDWAGIYQDAVGFGWLQWSNAYYAGH